MDLYRKIIIVIIIIIFSYIIFRLIQKRRLLLNIQSTPISTENFEQSDELSTMPLVENFKLPSILATPESELAKMVLTDSPPTIQDFDTTISDLPITDYIIKSAYNAAFTGSYINIDALKYLITRGVRCFHFQLFYIGEAVYVAQSKDSAKIHINSNNHILLNNVLKYLSIYAFTAPSPNPHDPLFIMFEMSAQDQEIYKATAMAIDLNCKDRLFKNRNNSTSHLISKNMDLVNLMGKIVIIVDKIAAPNYNTYPICNTTDNPNYTCYNLDNYVHIVAGRNPYRLYTYSDILDQTTTPFTVNLDNISTDIEVIKIAIPSITDSNPDARPFIMNYSVQFLFYQFYLPGNKLNDYEAIFSNSKSAFVPFAKVQSILDTINV